MVINPYSATIIDQRKYESSKIIQLLNDIQNFHGYLPREELNYISNRLNVPFSKLWGIITFYSHYKLTKPANYTVRVCEGTACHVKNSAMLKQNFEDNMENIAPEIYATESVACLGCCALAPVFEVNGEVHGNMNTSKVKQLSSNIKKQEGLV